MAFNAKQMAIMAIKNKQKQGTIPKNPMSPQNLFKSLPNIAPPSPIVSQANPMMPATANMAAPKLPGLPKFGGIRKKIRGF